MLSQGATTFWEQWNEYYAHILSCFTRDLEVGSIGDWMESDLMKLNPTSNYFQRNNIIEGGVPVEDAIGIAAIKNEGGASLYKVESGNYSFESTLDQAIITK